MIQIRTLLAAAAVALMLPFAASARFVVTSQSAWVSAGAFVSSGVSSNALTPLNLTDESGFDLAKLSTSLAPDLLVVDAMAAAGSPNPLSRGSASAQLQLGFTVTEGTDVTIQVASNRGAGTFNESLTRLNGDGTRTTFMGSALTTLTHMDAGDWSLNTLVAFSGNSFIARQRVSIAAVPEPSALATMGLGLGAMAWVARRRSARSVRPD